MICRIGDLVTFNPESIKKSNNYDTINYLDTSNLTNNIVSEIVNLKISEAPSRAKRIIRKGDILYSTVRPNLCHYGIVEKDYESLICSTGFAVLRAKENVNPYYLYFYLTLPIITEKLHSIAENSTSAYPSIKPDDIANIEINIPSIDIQNKVANILQTLESKIDLNNQVNDNLEEQLKNIFYNKFFKNIVNNNLENYELKTLEDILTVIDNRGKTPSLVEYSAYPIIDVKALSGNGRIIDYSNCQKFVSLDVFNNFFRSGHPQKEDILISTVGSLAELKIFYESKGTIAQNVVALRSKTEYPMYIYQYLKAIKKDLVSYNIGSVQPSIKVTQFMKHSIYIPNYEKLMDFENIAKIFTQKIYNNEKENQKLEQLRDTLLPKLMNGEIDLENVEI